MCVYPSIICSSTIHFNNQYDLFCCICISKHHGYKMLRNCKRVVLYAHPTIVYIMLFTLKKENVPQSFLCNTLRLLYIIVANTLLLGKKTTLSLSYHVSRILNAFKSHDFRKGIKGIRRMKRREEEEKKGKIFVGRQT